MDNTTALSTLATLDNSVSLVAVRINEGNRWPRLGKTAPDQALTMMREIVLSAFLYRAQKVDEQVVDFTTRNFLGELLQDNEWKTRDLSWYEVTYAVKKAVFSRDMFSVSVASLFTAVITYIKTEGAGYNAQAHTLRRNGRTPVQTLLDARAAEMADKFRLNQ